MRRLAKLGALLDQRKGRASLRCVPYQSISGGGGAPLHSEPDPNSPPR